MSYSRLWVVLIAAVVLSVVAQGCRCCGCGGKKMSGTSEEVTYISKDKVQDMMKMDKDVVVIDVLSPDSYIEKHVKGSINIPLKKLDEVAPTLDKSKTYIVYCANYKCKASTKGAKVLMAHGFPKVLDYKGGIKEWSESGLPVEAGVKCKMCGAAKGSPTCCK